MYWIGLIGYGYEMLWFRWWYVDLTLFTLCSRGFSTVMVHGPLMVAVFM